MLRAIALLHLSLAALSLASCNRNSTPASGSPTSLASQSSDTPGESQNETQNDRPDSDVDPGVAVTTQDKDHPFVLMLQQRLLAMRGAARDGDWEQYQQFRTQRATRQMLARLEKMNVDLAIGEMIKASAKHLKDPADHTFLRCDVGPDGKVARIAYETKAASHEGFWILKFHLEDDHWRLGDSGNTITTPNPDKPAPTLEAAIEDLGLGFTS